MEGGEREWGRGPSPTDQAAGEGSDEAFALAARCEAVQLLPQTAHVRD